MALNALIDRTLRVQPDPPRSVSLAAVLGAVLRTPVGVFGPLFGAICVLAGVAFFATAKGALFAEVVGLFFTAFGLLVTAVPFIYARRIVTALRVGIRTTATIVSLDELRGPGRQTLDAMKNGFAAGVRRVHHPAGDFEERFQYDGPGAMRLSTGSTVRVLVNPDVRKVFIDAP